MIRLSNITKIYSTGFLNKKNLTAVDNLNLEIEEEEIFTLLGPNGAGKTTTIKMICGLIKPTSGKIYINGNKFNKNSKKLIGAVLEGSRNVYWNLSVLENLFYFARIHNCYDESTPKYAQNLLKQFDLYEKKSTPVGKLSRGMQQKVALCCALIKNPSILLIDEPTLGLDIASSKKIKEMIINLSRKEGKTILLTTHDMKLSSEVSDRIGIINKGRLIRIGKLEEFKKDFQRSVYKIHCEGSYETDFILSLQKKFSNINIKMENQDTFLIQIHMSEFSNLYEILNFLKNNHIVFSSIEKEQPDLEDIFLKLTGGM